MTGSAYLAGYAWIALVVERVAAVLGSGSARLGVAVEVFGRAVVSVGKRDHYFQDVLDCLQYEIEEVQLLYSMRRDLEPFFQNGEGSAE